MRSCWDFTFPLLLTIFIQNIASNNFFVFPLLICLTMRSHYINITIIMIFSDYGLNKDYFNNFNLISLNIVYTVYLTSAFHTGGFPPYLTTPKTKVLGTRNLAIRLVFTNFFLEKCLLIWWRHHCDAMATFSKIVVIFAMAFIQAVGSNFVRLLFNAES